MPIFEYACRECGTVFEELVTSADGPAPRCPKCDARRVEKRPSVFAAHGGRSTASPLPRAGGCGRCGDPNGPCGVE